MLIFSGVVLGDLFLVLGKHSDIFWEGKMLKFFRADSQIFDLLRKGNLALFGFL